ncbi:MAG: hypothetical protein ACI91G_001044 [Gammaproteobacteria bacterium]|jgi:hypothetical protein
MKAIRRTALILLVSLLGLSVSASTIIFKVTAFEGGPGFKEIQKANYYLALKRITRGVSAPLSHGFERALSLNPYNTQASDNLQHLLNVKSYR